LWVSDGIWDDFMVALPCISSFRYRALLEKLTALFWDDVAQVAARTGLEVQLLAMLRHGIDTHDPWPIKKPSYASDSATIQIGN